MEIMFLIGTLFGAVLGLRFTVFVLVPAIAIAIAVMVITGLSLSHGTLGWSTLIDVAASAVGLQLGYLVASFRFLIPNK